MSTNIGQNNFPIKLFTQGRRKEFFPIAADLNDVPVRNFLASNLAVDLSEVAKEDTIEGGGRAAKEELLGAKQLGDGLQVLEGHLPDLRFCVPSDSLQVGPETVSA